MAASTVDRLPESLHLCSELISEYNQRLPTMLHIPRLPSLRSSARALVVALIVLGLSALVLLFPQDLQRLGSLGYAGVFLVTLVASSALVLPVPYLATIFLAARSLDPTAVALVAGVAAALGELTGYALGASGRVLIHDRRWMERLAKWRGLRTFLAVLTASFIPNPVFDVIGIAAGTIGLAPWRFVLASFIGKTLRFLLVAGVGHRFFPL